VALGRTAMDAPEIDGVVRFGGAGRLPIGGFVQVRITGSDAHDLEGEMVAQGDGQPPAKAAGGRARARRAASAESDTIAHDEKMDR
jgi:hypothetical protein